MTVYHTSAAEGCTHVHDMCTALLSSAQNKNEKEALAMPELTSRFRDFFFRLFLYFYTARSAGQNGCVNMQPNKDNFGVGIGVWILVYIILPSSVTASSRAKL